MKKACITAIILVMIVMTAACNSTDNTADNTKKSSEETTNITASDTLGSTAATSDSLEGEDSLTGTTWVFEGSYYDDGTAVDAELQSLFEENAYEFISGNKVLFTSWAVFPKEEGTYILRDTDKVEITLPSATGQEQISAGAIDGDKMSFDIGGSKQVFVKK